ncbi:glycosyltransferase family 2 protein [Halothiobacillus diazotrophicus]|uniref:glycosyltransferase family 2 protein n=1 Tax=Halothiobacillus diazotrophicus TaxID=1860122 RepID=UPI0009EE2206|nr:glycosyltransferase family 2 protein [Halothiobacillus diazotrophicus]
MQIKAIPDHVYQNFILRNDTLSADDVEKIDSHITELKFKPLFSILLFPDESNFFLIDAINSVLAQRYRNLELIIAVNPFTNADTLNKINEYAHLDSRIKPLYHKETFSFIRSFNSALKIVSGDYIIQLSGDDFMAAQALYHFAVEANRFDSAHIIYSDEDQIKKNYFRLNPHFKPDWNLEYFLSHNYIGKSFALKSLFVRSLKGIKYENHSLAFFDLIMRMLNHISAKQIRHIPRVLLHTRNSDQDSSTCPHDVQYLRKRARIANKHLAPMNGKTKINSSTNSLNIEFQYDLRKHFVSIIIPTRNELQKLYDCISSISTNTKKIKYEIIIVNNQSSHPEKIFAIASQFPHLAINIIDFDSPFNFSTINNLAAKHSKGDIICLLNNDTVILKNNWLIDLVSHAARPDIGAVGPKLLYPTGQIQHAGVILGIGGVAAHAYRLESSDSSGYLNRLNCLQEVSAVTGACLAVKKSIFFLVGGLDESLSVAFNDVDFCLKVNNAGFRNLFIPYISLQHFESLTRNAPDQQHLASFFEHEVDFMKKKWGKVLTSDPFYNPNLTLSASDFSLSTSQVESPHHGYPLVI